MQKEEAGKHPARLVSKWPSSGLLRQQGRFELSDPELNFFSTSAAGNGVPASVGLLQRRFGAVPFAEKCAVSMVGRRWVHRPLLHLDESCSCDCRGLDEDFEYSERSEGHKEEDK